MRAAHALVAAVAVVLVGAPGARRQQLGVKLAVGRRGRGGQHQRLERRHFCLEDVDLGVAQGGEEKKGFRNRCNQTKAEKLHTPFPEPPSAAFLMQLV